MTDDERIALLRKLITDERGEALQEHDAPRWRELRNLIFKLTYDYDVALSLLRDGDDGNDARALVTLVAHASQLEGAARALVARYEASLTRRGTVQCIGEMGAPPEWRPVIEALEALRKPLE